jgi:hypothetical protein
MFRQGDIGIRPRLLDRKARIIQQGVERILGEL